MTRALPVVSSAQVVKAFERLGWEVVRRKGSHIIMVREGHVATLSIPDHKEIARGTLRSLLRAAGLTSEQFLDALQDS